MSLNDKMTALADAIRAKTGGSSTMTLDQMTQAVSGITVGDGGIDTSDATATETDMARGVTAYVNGKKITGTVETRKDGTGLNFNDEDVTILDRSSSGLVLLYAVPGKNYLIRPSVEVALYAELGRFGDATAADVAAGKTFTSVAGLKVTGTATSGSSGGIQTQHITARDEAITISGTGTVKVWGYGYYSSGSYSNTTYAFVGDGYYTASSYGTPSKTSATFSISNGTLSGLPSNLTTVDLLVTIGI